MELLPIQMQPDKMKSIAAIRRMEIGVITSIYDVPFSKTSNNIESNMPQTS